MQEVGRRRIAVHVGEEFVAPQCHAGLALRGRGWLSSSNVQGSPRRCRGSELGRSNSFAVCWPGRRGPSPGAPISWLRSTCRCQSSKAHARPQQPWPATRGRSSPVTSETFSRGPYRRQSRRGSWLGSGRVRMLRQLELGVCVRSCTAPSRRPSTAMMRIAAVRTRRHARTVFSTRNVSLHLAFSMRGSGVRIRDLTPKSPSPQSRREVP